MASDTRGVGTPVVEAGLGSRVEGAIDRGVDVRVDVRFLAPERPKLAGGGGRTVEGVGAAEGQEELGIGEQVGDLIGLLVAQGLADRLGDGLLALQIEVRALALDHDEGDTVDEEGDIGAARAVAAALFDQELIGDVIDIVLGVAPIDVVEAEALAIAVDGLRHAGPEGEHLIEAGVGDHEALQRLVEEATEGLADTGVGESVVATLERDRVVGAQPGLQDAGEDNILLLATTEGEGLGGSEVLPAQIDEQLQRGDLGANDFFERVGGGHALLLFCLVHADAHLAGQQALHQPFFLRY